jgi:hypothetical protein
VVTAASLMDPALCVPLNKDEEAGYRFDEPDDPTHAHAATIHRSQGGEHSAWSSLEPSAWPILQRNPVHTTMTRPCGPWCWSAAGAWCQSGPQPGAGGRSPRAYRKPRSESLQLSAGPQTASCKAHRSSLSSEVMQSGPTTRTAKTRPGSGGRLHYP